MATKEILIALKLNNNFIVTFEKNGQQIKAKNVVPAS
jgi:hypothetical protein